VPGLLAAGRFDYAEARARAYLRAHPGDPSAHYLMAQLALARPGPGDAEAVRALEHLDKIKAISPHQAALVELYQGKAQYYLARLDAAETSWKKALDLDPTVPEAGWGLLDLYFLQGRTKEAVRLALRLHEVEPDPRDRVRLLLELVRQDYQTPAPRYLVQWFEPRARKSPDDLHAALGLGRGLILNSRIEEGLALLRKTVDAHPDDPEAWDAYLSGLDDGGAEVDAWAEALGRLPKALADDPRFARHRGRAAQERLDWPAAVALYRQACEHDPGNPKLLYRLGRALRFAGQTAEAERVERAYQDSQVAKAEVGSLYEEADANKSLGAVPDPVLYRRLGDLRKRMGRRGEAIAWYRLVLRADPDDPQSRAALARLASR
jgi:tetratricopeptide (TPR) repeat protein